ncbi:TorF family putative porin [Kordiimonas gwangyangensis]|uniref:TorF family putative porin n=1 Tax=Kordiimonas gwangyangensis TaxID=288022 RepID=UPI000374A126|nr:TorF family putative porin [Kordiimonas gwangyangensis]
MPKFLFSSSKFRSTCALAALAIGAVAPTISTGASAQESTSPFSFSANAAIVTEYRFRGLSLSNHDPAIQGGFDVSHESGFYIGTWGSSIESYAGSEFEMDIYGGYATEIEGLTFDVGLLAYTYPGSKGTYYLELYSSIGGTAGIVDWTLGAAYVWDQDNVGGTDNIYAYVDASVPLGDTPFSLSGHLAYEDGAFGNDKWDWNAGVAYAFEQFSLSVSYVDTNVSGIGKGAIVGMLSASF